MIAVVKFSGDVLLIDWFDDRYNLIQDKPSCMWPWRRPLWKKMWNPRWQPRNGCDGRLMIKILTMTIQVNLYCFLHIGFGTKFTWIVVKFFSINLLSQPLLGCHLGFHIFFTMAFFRTVHFFTTGPGCFGLDFTSFCNCILCIVSIYCYK